MVATATRNATKAGRITGPGYFPGVSDEEYFAYDALNHSTAKAGIGATMADMRFYMDAPKEPSSESQILGTLLGIRLFDPERYRRVCIPGPINPETQAPYGATSVKYRTFAASVEADGKIPMGSGPNGAHADLVEAMYAKVMAHPLASKLVAAPGDLEPVAVWDEPVFDVVNGERVQVGSVRCKAKADKLIQFEGHIARRVEVKTTKDTAPASWFRDIGTFKYHTQDEFYDRGFSAALGVKMQPAWLLVVQNCDAHVPVVDCIDAPSKRVASILLDEVLLEYHRARTSGQWPGPGFNRLTGAYEVRSVGLPAYELAKFKESL